MTTTHDDIHMLTAVDHFVPQRAARYSQTPEEVAIAVCDQAELAAHSANSAIMEAEQAVKFPVFHPCSSDRHGDGVTALWRVLLFGFSIGAISTLVWMVTR